MKEKAEQLTFKVFTSSGSLESSITIQIGSDVEAARRKLEWFMKQLYNFLETFKDEDDAKVENAEAVRQLPVREEGQGSAPAPQPRPGPDAGDL
jgi:hypothetical protein